MKTKPITQRKKVNTKTDIGPWVLGVTLIGGCFWSLGLWPLVFYLSWLVFVEK